MGFKKFSWLDPLPESHKIMPILNNWKQKAKNLKRELYAIYLAYKDPRVPWYAKALAIIVVGYAFSPIDLIPDPIPVLGYLDDLILLPLGIALVIRLIPKEVLSECREKAAEMLNRKKPRNWVAAGIVVFIWIFLFVLLSYYLVSAWGS